MTLLTEVFESKITHIVCVSLELKRQWIRHYMVVCIEWTWTQTDSGYPFCGLKSSLDAALDLNPISMPRILCRVSGDTNQTWEKELQMTSDKLNQTGLSNGAQSCFNTMQFELLWRNVNPKRNPPHSNQSCVQYSRKSQMDSFQTLSHLPFLSKS